jgi:hypothetical protein
MKKIYLLAFSIASFLGVNAQNTLTQTNHAPANGDMYQMYHCDSVNTVPGGSGANVTWNFSTLATYSNLVSSYTAQSVSGSPTYPSANVAVASAMNNTSYYASSSGNLLYYGGNIAVGTVAGSLTYTAPAVNASYPMSLNTTSSSPISGTVNVTSPISTSGSFTGTSMVVADGTGTLMVPGGGVYPDVIRVKTTQTINISAATTATVYQVNYDYYANGTKAPIVSIMTATAAVNLAGTSTSTVVLRNKTAVPPPPVGIPGISNNSNFAVYPNPASSSVNFVMDNQEAKQVHIYDVTGKLIEKQSLSDGKLKLDVSGYTRGLYLYTITNSADQKIKSGRFTVSQ